MSPNAQGADRPEVVIIDSYRARYVETPDLERQILEPRVRVTLQCVNGPEELIGRIEDADAIISWHTVPLQKDILGRLRKCRGIVRAAVGFDNIDVALAAERQIPVSIIPDYGTEEVADHAMALLLALVRNLRGLSDHARSGGWDWRASGKVMRLRGAILGIVGFGRIGASVARRAQAFGMQVLFYDPYVPSGTDKVHSVSRCESLPELLSRSQIVSLHVPLRPETRHLIGAAELGLLTPTSILINTSRGEIIDQQALLNALAAGQIGRVGLDVLENEPSVPEPLRQSDRVLLTAHSAFYSDASLLELRRKAAMAALGFISGQPPYRDIVTPGIHHPQSGAKGRIGAS